MRALTTTATRRRPLGAELLLEGGAHFRVWAPRCRKLELELGHGVDGLHPVITLEPEPEGYFSGAVPDAAADMLYRFKLPTGSFPDPASRFQPYGPHGPSQIIDPGIFEWTDTDWKGIPRNKRVIYEMHIGTFTQEGTWAAAKAQLPELAAFGVTLLEVMPVADFAGNFGWGYDGVNLFAPTRVYGTPDEFRSFVNRAHELGLGVILDVVYNHFGPDGNYLKEFSEDYFSSRYNNEWGEAINFDATNSGPVREFFCENAGYWIEEFHLDGLRLDAAQQIFDQSPEHILAVVTRRVRTTGAGRTTFVVAENERQESRLCKAQASGGYGLDALWNDDFHHSARVAATGHNEAYYSDYRGAPQELLTTAKSGFIYQGQPSAWQKKPRGSPTAGLALDQFVTYLQNHDQVANSLTGQRLHELTSPGRLRALTTFLLLHPSIPMLFQGQEFCASAPFLYFADHRPELASLVAKGRKEFLLQFKSIGDPAAADVLADPGDPATFLRCKLDFGERKTHKEAYAFHRELLRLRREDSVFGRAPQKIDGAVIAQEAFVLRFLGEPGEERLLVVNLGRELVLSPTPEPLLAPPQDREWELVFSSEAPGYGGLGTPPVCEEGSWHICGHATLVLGTKRSHV